MKAIRIDSNDPKAHHNLGLTYYNLGFYEDAIEVCKQAIRIFSDDADFHLRRHGGLEYITPYEKLEKVIELLS